MRSGGHITRLASGKAGFACAKQAPFFSSLFSVFDRSSTCASLWVSICRLQRVYLSFIHEKKNIKKLKGWLQDRARKHSKVRRDKSVATNDGSEVDRAPTTSSM
uniref:Uncharacterized protein n=1 Tax=Leersia perrieri TaxID=77586 RepID=A0A0D9X347_9ORYZ